MNFEEIHMELILQYGTSAVEIERAIFTKRYNINRKHFSLLSIQSISILYSYWEGFIQKSFQLYIDYLNKQEIDFRCFCNSIIIYHMENTFKQFYNYPQNDKKKLNFYKKLDKHFIQEKHEIYRVVDTNSNVDFIVLNRLLKQFSLETFPEYWRDYTYPNPSLKETLNTFIRYRNGVAHGGDISSEEKITQEVYSKYRKLVNDLMYSIHEKFIDGIENKTYLKKV